MTKPILYDAKCLGFDDALAGRQPQPERDAAAYGQDATAQKTWRVAYMAGYYHARDNFSVLSKANCHGRHKSEHDRDDGPER